MSEVAGAAKAATKSTAAAKAESAKPVLTMRDSQPKRLAPSALKPLGYGDSEILTVTAPSGMTFDEIMAPVAWSNVASVVAKDALNTRNLRDGVGSLIFLDTADSRFNAHLRIKRVLRDSQANPCGLEMMCVGPSIDIKTGEARPIDLATGKAWIDPVKAD